MDIRWLLSFEMTGLFSAGVLVLLMTLSVLSWGIIFRKLAVFRRVRRADRFCREFYSRPGGSSTPARNRNLEREREWSSFYLVARLRDEYAGAPGGDSPAARENLEEAVKVRLNEYFLDLSSGLPVLASISSAAPFLGLLGTVWGIMVIFSRLHGEIAGISEMVAPGVAQALITTIGGLLVAIPALLFYNYFMMILRHLTNDAENYASRLIYLE